MRTVRLADIASFVRGVTFKPSDVNGVGVGVMRTKNVQQQLDLSDVIRIPAHLVKRDAQYLLPGDTLISSANSWQVVGKACWVPPLKEPMAIGGFVTALRPDQNVVDSRFLYRYFTAPRTQALLRSFSSQTTSIANLNLSRTGDLEVPLPALEEQRRIAEILDRADVLREKRRQALAMTSAFSAALFKEMFEAERAIVRLNEVAVVRGGKRLPKGASYSKEPTRHPYIRVVDLVDGTIEKSNLRYIDDGVYSGISRYVVDVDDVIISIAGTIGSVAPVPTDLVGANLTENAARIVPREQGAYRPEWLAFALRTPTVQAQIRTHVGQVTVGKLALFRIEKLEVPMPPLQMQDLFLSRVKASRKWSGQSRRVATAGNELFGALQYRAFRGEL